MTERAVWTTYQQFLEQLTDEMLDIVEEEFGGGLFGRAAKSGAKRVTKGLQEEMQTQGKVIVGYTVANANDADDTTEYEQRFLETNPVYQRYDGDRTAELKDHLLTHFHSVGADLAPLVASPTDDFWAALSDEYTRTEAEQIVDSHFSQAETFIEYKSGLFPSRKLADRVIAIMEEGERRLREDLYTELDRVYAE